MRHYLLGIDAGTSVVKAALFNEQGQQGSSAAYRTTLKTPHPSWAETSMAETWDMAVRAIRELLHTAGVTGDQVAAVGVTGNMVGAWLVDERGQPARDAILWCDGRAQALIERLSAEHPGFMSEIYQVSGSVMQQGCTLPVLRWLAENEPGTLERARYVLHCKDWLVYNLTGTIQVDPTEASVLPGDTRARGHSQAMFDLLGVSEYRPLFPPVKPSEAVIGTITPEAAALTGLRAGTPVVAGAGDVPASAIGVGAVEPGIACSLLGTNFLNCLVVDHPVFEPPDVGLLFVMPGGNWLRAMVNVSGTTSLDWAIEQFAAPEKAAAASPADLFARVEALATNSELGARGVLYLPYLSLQGIIAPIVEPAARANFFGLTDEHTRADLMRAVYEGLALSVREGYEAIPGAIDEIRLSGGGAKSEFFCQMIADCLGTPVVVPSGGEFGARGAALLAGVGIGWFASLRQAAKVAHARQYYPNLALKPAYDRLQDLYAELRTALLPVWRRSAQAR